MTDFSKRDRESEVMLGIAIGCSILAVVFGIAAIISAVRL